MWPRPAPVVSFPLSCCPASAIVVTFLPSPLRRAFGTEARFGPPVPAESLLLFLLWSLHVLSISRAADVRSVCLSCVSVLKSPIALTRNFRTVFLPGQARKELFRSPEGRGQEHRTAAPACALYGFRSVPFLPARAVRDLGKDTLGPRGDKEHLVDTVKDNPVSESPRPRRQLCLRLLRIHAGDRKGTWAPQCDCRDRLP